MKIAPLVILSALAAPALAQPIALSNAGFELPVLADNGYVFGAPGWTSLGTSGVLNPAVAAFPGQAPEGANVGFLSCCFGPNPNSGSLAQTLATTYAADTTYTLSVQSGTRLDDPGLLRQYRFVAASGSTLLATKTFTTIPTAGTFRTDTLAWNVFAGDAAVGRPITFRLLHVSGNGQLLVDDVQLVASALCVAVRTQPDPTPEACPTQVSEVACTVGGSGPFTFTWEYENPTGVWNALTSGGPGPSGTSTVAFTTTNAGKTSTLRIFNFKAADDKNYRLNVTTTCGGSAISDTANFTFCPPDYACDGFVDFADYLEFILDFERGLPSADFNSDSIVDFFDLIDFIDAFVEGC
jgi:hypothetical protein